MRRFYNMQKKYFGIIFAVLIPLTTAIMAQAQTAATPKNEVEVTGNYVFQSGSLRFSTATIPGTVVSLKDDVALKNNVGYGLRYTYRSENGKHKIWAAYSHTSGNNTTTLARTFVFLGQTYTANLAVHAEHSLGMFLASYAYRWGNKKVRIGPMAQLGWSTTRVALAAVSNNAISAKEGSVSALAGAFGYDMEINPSAKINIYNNVGFAVLSGERFARGEAGLRYSITKAFGLTGGFKFGKYKVLKNDNYIQASQNGPVFGAFFRF